MPKKLLALALCFFLLAPILAFAADIDFSAYSSKELKTLLRAINYRLALEYPKDGSENIIYEDDRISIEYLQFEAKAMQRFELDLCITNKSNETFTFSPRSFALNRLFVESNDSTIDIAPQTSITATHSSFSTHLSKFPVKRLESISLSFDLWTDTEEQRIFTDHLIVP